MTFLIPCLRINIITWNIALNSFSNIFQIQYNKFPINACQVYQIISLKSEENKEKGNILIYIIYHFILISSCLKLKSEVKKQKKDEDSRGKLMMTYITITITLMIIVLIIKICVFKEKIS